MITVPNLRTRPQHYLLKFLNTPIPMTDLPNPVQNSIEQTLALLRDATRNTPYEGKLYLVGGFIRDRKLGLPLSNDLDLVLEDSAPALAQFLYRKGIAAHYPVIYERFGTAMLHLVLPDGSESQLEFVTARAESYDPDSRKPDVRKATLREDVFRRDFTLNSLLENLHTGEQLDLTGRGVADLEAGIIRTPLAPAETFFDDPLRMLRAVRFAARFGFQIEAETWNGIVTEAERLRSSAISAERIRDEFVKIMKLPGERAKHGLQLLLEAGLLEEFLPEMLPMVGCIQGGWHPLDVWDHSLLALEALPDAARLEVRLAVLWHDVAKPATKEVTDGHTRFPEHATIGGQMARTMMNRLKFSNEEIHETVFLIERHMRFGEYRPEWSDAAIKRLLREVGTLWEDLVTVTKCDQSALDLPDENRAKLPALLERATALSAQTDVLKIVSPLDGGEIMAVLGIPPGHKVKRAKDFLTNEVLEGAACGGRPRESEGSARSVGAERGRVERIGWIGANGV